MFENLYKILNSNLGFTSNYILLGSALYFTACRLDDNTTKPCTYSKADKNSNCKQQVEIKK